MLQKFDIRFLNGVGNANVSRTFGQIHENTVFRDLCTIVWDNSDAMVRVQVAKEYCPLSFIDTQDCRSQLDECDLMRMDEFQKSLISIKW